MCVGTGVLRLLQEGPMGVQVQAGRGRWAREEVWAGISGKEHLGRPRGEAADGVPGARAARPGEIQLLGPAICPECLCWKAWHLQGVSHLAEVLSSELAPGGLGGVALP